MTVYRQPRGRTYTYDFWFRGERYRGSTGQLRKADAERWEKREQLRIAQHVGGVAPFDVDATPRFQEWAEVYYEHAAARMKRPERIEWLLRLVLRFWGQKPARGAVEGMPYHDLHLGHPIADPQWIVRFETWMAQLPRFRPKRGGGIERVEGTRGGRSGQSKNQYRSALSQLYRLALLPEWRGITGIQQNPFMGLARDRQGRRTVALTPDQVRALIAAASYHVRLALAIGALAPKLRLSNILALRWDQHLDAQLRWITVRDHKTDRKVDRPLVVPITEQLRQVLLDARDRAGRKAKNVVTYRGQPLKGLRNGLAGAAARAGLTYGRGSPDGLTFHTLRHTAATLLAELEQESTLRQRVMGHERLETTLHYTHLRPTAELAPLEELSTALPIVDLVTQPRRRARAISANFGGPRAKRGA